MAKAKPMGTGQVQVALEERYAGEAWALFFEVRNGTGYARRTRSADALAMSLWPSRGLELHGHEIKASRGDWLSELRKPAKAEEICRFCDRWWVVVGDASIVKDGELPPTWGLLVPRGKKLIVKVDAPKLTPEPVTRLFLASLMRSIDKYKPADADLQAKVERSYERGRARGNEERDMDAKIAEKAREYAETKLEELRAEIKTFNEASGLHIQGWNVGNIGQDVRDFMQSRYQMEGVAKAVGEMADALTTRTATLRATASALRKIAEKTGLEPCATRC